MSDIPGEQAEPSPSSFSRMNLGLSQGLLITKQSPGRGQQGGLSMALFMEYQWAWIPLPQGGTISDLSLSSFKIQVFCNVD